jgi:broad specificity phosphatase PhoE
VFQAGTLAEKLSNLGIEILYCSPLWRARETAGTINKKLNISVKIVDGLKERDYGVLGGMIKSEARERYPDVVEKHKDVYNTDPGGESYEEFKDRVLNAFDDLVKSSSFGTIAVITHGGPIKLIYRELLGRGELDRIGDCDYLELERDNKFRLISPVRLLD